MDEKTALEEIQFIRTVIEESKRSIIYNGADYIFWGAIIITGMLTQYILLLLKQVHIPFFWLWLVLIAFGWAWSLRNNKKHNQKYPPTYGGKIMGAVWSATGITMTLVGFLGPISHAISPMAISPLLSIIVGIAYFVTGVIVKLKWLRNIAIGWWAGGIIMFYVFTIHQFLIMALLMFFFQTLPGIMMYRKYRQQIAMTS